MRNINNGFNATKTNANVYKKIPKKIPIKSVKTVPQQKVVWGKKKEYIWIPMTFDFSELDNA